METRENRDHVLGLMSVRLKVRQLHYVPAPQWGINTALLLSLCGLPRTPFQLLATLTSFFTVEHTSF